MFFHYKNPHAVGTRDLQGVFYLVKVAYMQKFAIVWVARCVMLCNNCAMLI